MQSTSCYQYSFDPRFCLHPKKKTVDFVNIIENFHVVLFSNYNFITQCD